MNPNPNLITLVCLSALSLLETVPEYRTLALVNPVTNCSLQFSRKDVCGVYVYLYLPTHVYCDSVNHRK